MPVIERTVITNDGVRLAVRDYGSRRAEHTVVLLHGLFLNQDSWADQIRELGRRWGQRVRVISYDHRGHGRSDAAPMATYRVDRLAADLADVLTAVRVTGSVTLAGHSMGGMTALAYLGRPAHQRPVDPQGLVLVATAAGKLVERGIGRLLDTPATEGLFELVRRMPHRLVDRQLRGVARPLRAVLSTLARRDPSVAATVSALRRPSLATAAGFLVSLKHYDQYATLASITADTVVLSGGADNTTPVAHAVDMASAIPDAIHVHHEDAGHMLLQDASRCVNSALDRVMGLRAVTGCCAAAA